MPILDPEVIQTPHVAADEGRDAGSSLPRRIAAALIALLAIAAVFGFARAAQATPRYVAMDIGAAIGERGSETITAAGKSLVAIEDPLRVYHDRLTVVSASGTGIGQQLPSGYQSGVSNAADEESSTRLAVPLIMQLPELPTGCEATSVAMMLNYAGVKVTKQEVADKMPYDPYDPAKGFVGDPYSWEGITIYPPAFEPMLKKYLGSFVDLSGKGLEDIRACIDADRPVVVWIDDGADFLHCVCVTGYDEGGLFFNDPLIGFMYLDNDYFSTLWKYLGNLALSY